MAKVVSDLLIAVKSLLSLNTSVAFDKLNHRRPLTQAHELHGFSVYFSLLFTQITAVCKEVYHLYRRYYEWFGSIR